MNMNQSPRTNSYDDEKSRKVGVVGLGYVGLPVAITFGETYQVIGIDTNKNKIKQLNKAIDPNGELYEAELQKKSIEYVSKPDRLRECTHIIVAVPSHITNLKEPDLTMIEDANKKLGKNLSKHT